MPFKLPVIRGVIDRRILVNYRVDPEVLARLLPSPFRPQLVNGMAMAGICLIRLRNVRPQGLPAWMGIASENAAHRMAVEWDDGGVPRQGVYVRRRDTSHWLNALAGGRLFPGRHCRAKFRVEETPDRFHVGLKSLDQETRMEVRAARAASLPRESVFASLEEASQFFQAGSLGYSPTLDWRRFQGLELRCLSWKMEPLAVESVQSSFFDDGSLFPRGSIEFDSAFLMRNIEHQWHGRAELVDDSCWAGLARRR